MRGDRGLMRAGGRKGAPPASLSWEEIRAWESWCDLEKDRAAKPQTGGKRLVSGGQRLAHGPRELPLRALSVGEGGGRAMGTGGAVGTSCRPLPELQTLGES